MATYLLEVAARVSLKVATKGSVRGKKNSQNLDVYDVFLKQKGRSGTKLFKMCFINLAALYLVQLHIFWKLVHVFH